MGPNAVAFIISAIQSLPGLVAAGSSIVAEVETLSGQIKLFQSQNRDPTPEEWAAQNLRLSSAVSGLLAAKAS